MARSSGTLQLALPEFSGVTRQLVLWNLGAYFLLLILSAAHLMSGEFVGTHLAFVPQNFLAGYLWQPITYSFVHPQLLTTFFELLMVWFMGSLLEGFHGGRWFGGLYAASVAGSAATALVVCVVVRYTGSAHEMPAIFLTGCSGALFGILSAIGILHGDLEFRLFFMVLIKARYLAAIYALITLAYAFGEGWIYALAQLGAGAASLLYLRTAPRRGFGFGFGVSISERWYGLRNGYYRWKRRRAASKFQVYMKKQGRTVKFDGQGRLLDEDDARNGKAGADDRKRWN
jgi:membrane associated rhomboid family serine protease